MEKNGGGINGGGEGEKKKKGREGELRKKGDCGRCVRAWSGRRKLMRYEIGSGEEMGLCEAH